MLYEFINRVIAALRSPGRCKHYGGTVTAVWVCQRRVLCHVDYDDSDEEGMPEGEFGD